MNIFYLDKNPRRAAEMMHDKHVVKMVLETAQILSTVCHRHGCWVPEMYRPTHANHPSVLWAGESVERFQWLYAHGLWLGKEFEYRYGHAHKSSGVIDLVPYFTPQEFPQEHWTEPPQAMPDEFKIAGDSVAAYRAYYLGRKVEQSGWTRRPVPAFIIEGKANMAKKKQVEPVEASTPAVEESAVEQATPAEKKFVHNKKLGVSGEIADDAMITWNIDKNPRSPGKGTFTRFAAYFGAETVSAYVARGGTKGDLLWDLRCGYLSIEGVELGGELTPRARVAKEPAPKTPRAKRGKAAAQDAAEPATVDDVAVEETID